MQEKSLTLKYIKASHNFYKFGVNDGDVIATVYVNKKEFDTPPATIQIKVEEINEKNR